MLRSLRRKSGERTSGTGIWAAVCGRDNLLISPSINSPLPIKQRPRSDQATATNPGDVLLCMSPATRRIQTRWTTKAMH